MVVFLRFSTLLLQQEFSCSFLAMTGSSGSVYQLGFVGSYEWNSVEVVSRLPKALASLTMVCTSATRWALPLAAGTSFSFIRQQWVSTGVAIN